MLLSMLKTSVALACAVKSGSEDLHHDGVHSPHLHARGAPASESTDVQSHGAERVVLVGASAPYQRFTCPDDARHIQAGFLLINEINEKLTKISHHHLYSGSALSSVTVYCV